MASACNGLEHPSVALAARLKRILEVRNGVLDGPSGGVDGPEGGVDDGPRGGVDGGVSSAGRIPPDLKAERFTPLNSADERRVTGVANTGTLRTRAASRLVCWSRIVRVRGDERGRAGGRGVQGPRENAEAEGDA